MGLLRDILIKIGGDTSQYEKSMRDMQLTTKKTTQSLQNMWRLAAAGVSVIAAGAVTQAIKKSLDFADAIGDAADRIGVSTNALQEYRYAAKLSGVEQEALDGNLEKFVKNLGEVRAGTGSLTTYLKKYDEQLLSNIRNAKNTDEALNLIFKTLGNTSSEADRAALAAAAFGKAGLGMTLMVKGGAAELDNMRQKARDLGIVMDESLIRNASDLNDKFDTLSSVVKTQLTSAVIQLAPGIETLVDLFTKLATKGGDVLKNNQDLIKEKVPEYVTKIVSASQKMWEIISYDPAITEYGLVGLALGGKKGAVIVGGVAHMTTVVNNLSKALGMASTGILDYKDIAKANFEELESLVKGGEAELRYRETGAVKHYRGKIPKASNSAPKLPEWGTQGYDYASLYKQDDYYKMMDQEAEEFFKLRDQMAEADRKLRDQRLEAARDVTEEINRLTMSDLDFQKWALDEKIKAKKAEAGDDKELVDKWDKYHTLALKKLSEKNKTFSEDMKDAFSGWAVSYSSTLNDMLWESELTFDGILGSFGKMITQMIIQKEMMRAADYVGDNAGNWFKAIGGAVSKYFSGSGSAASAKGNAFAGPGINAYENSIITKPTLFPFARGVGLMGEGVRPEAVLPLTRTSSGNLGVEAKVSSGTGNVQYIDMRGATFMDKDQLTQSIDAIAYRRVQNSTVEVLRNDYESDGWTRSVLGRG